MSDDLRGLRVWITRPVPAAHHTASLFTSRGAECTVESTVRLESLLLGEEERNRLRVFLPQARLVLTSANAANFFLDAIGDDPKLLAALRRTPVSAVGEITSKAASQRGFRVDHVASKALGVELARELVVRGETPKVVLPGSDLRRQEATDLLRAGGVEVLELTVYRTVPVEAFSLSLDKSLEERQFDLAMVYSPSAVTGMVQGVRALGRSPEELPPCAALGPVTAKAVEDEGCPLAVMAVDPGERSLLDAISRWWRQKGQR